MKAILGIKKGMTRVFDGEKSTPVTVIDVTGSKVAKISEGEIEIGLGQKKHPTKASLGQYKELGFVPMYKKVFKKLDGDDIKVGNELKADIFAKGDVVTVTGVSKGKGFAGVVRRWGFKGGPRTHGQSDRLRAPGSIGAGTDPGRVFKGSRMGGRMGSENITIKNKRIVGVKDSYILVNGPVPGSNGDLVTIISE